MQSLLLDTFHFISLVIVLSQNIINQCLLHSHFQILFYLNHFCDTRHQLYFCYILPGVRAPQDGDRSLEHVVLFTSKIAVRSQTSIERRYCQSILDTNFSTLNRYYTQKTDQKNLTYANGQIKLLIASSESHKLISKN